MCKQRYGKNFKSSSRTKIVCAWIENKKKNNNYDVEVEKTNTILIRKKGGKFIKWRKLKNYRERENIEKQTYWSLAKLKHFEWIKILFEEFNIQI